MDLIVKLAILGGGIWICYNFWVETEDIRSEKKWKKINKPQEQPSVQRNIYDPSGKSVLGAEREIRRLQEQDKSRERST